ncbi:hypothetical protein [Nocardia mexicana]|uniref:Uncharacterized protein n=1 Tax=Nocardia mexicana TaxID=279262 RepID=A0A370H743_9NOCA|nr:hypothetical protein [Nocardia mexicana]RDI51931.1 hypothetical protein DFR68_104415 [Nocardia mexicana]
MAKILRTVVVSAVVGVAVIGGSGLGAAQNSHVTAEQCKKDGGRVSIESGKYGSFKVCRDGKHDTKRVE